MLLLGKRGRDGSQFGSKLVFVPSKKIMQYSRQQIVVKLSGKVNKKTEMGPPGNTADYMEPKWRKGEKPTAYHFGISIRFLTKCIRDGISHNFSFYNSKGTPFCGSIIPNKENSQVGLSVQKDGAVSTLYFQIIDQKYWQVGGFEEDGIDPSSFLDNSVHFRDKDQTQVLYPDNQEFWVDRVRLVENALYVHIPSMKDSFLKSLCIALALAVEEKADQEIDEQGENAFFDQGENTFFDQDENTIFDQDGQELFCQSEQDIDESLREELWKFFILPFSEDELLEGANADGEE